MDREDLILKQYLNQSREILTADVQAPDTGTYYRYILGELSGAEELKVIEYLASHKEAQELVLKAQELIQDREAGADEVPAALLDSVKKISRDKTVASKKSTQFLWVVLCYSLSAFFLLLSFVVHRYYMQLLVLAALFGFKAIVDQRIHKTQVLVYKALKDQNEKNPDQTEKNRRF